MNERGECYPVPLWMWMSKDVRLTVAAVAVDSLVQSNFHTERPTLQGWRQKKQLARSSGRASVHRATLPKQETGRR